MNLGGVANCWDRTGEDGWRGVGHRRSLPLARFRMNLGVDANWRVTD